MAEGRTSIADLTQEPRNDAYTALLSISLAAIIGACVLLWGDIQQYPKIKPTDVAPVPKPRPAQTQPQ